MSARKLGKVWLSADSLGMGGHLVDLEALVSAATLEAMRGQTSEDIARRILALVEKEARRG